MTTPNNYSKDNSNPLNIRKESLHRDTLNETANLVDWHPITCTTKDHEN